jgi:uncharacterized membrane protein required for colicin V production
MISGRGGRLENKRRGKVDYFTMAAVVWLAIFLLLGLLKGFWKSLAAATSLVLAYVASVYFAPGLADWAVVQFASLNISRTVWWGVGATIIFIIVSLVVRLIVLGVSKSLPISPRIFDRIAGALVSIGYGAVLGAALLWGLAFLADSWNLRQERMGGQADPRLNTSSPAVTWSRQMMSRWINWNVRQSGGSDALAGVSAAIMERPGQVMADVQATVQSPEFKELVRSENVQALVAQRNAEELQRSVEFQQLMRQPAVKQLREAIAPESGGWSDTKIAQETVDIWTRVEQLRTQPEVAELLNDPELQAFLKGGGKVTPSLIDKGQKLLALFGREAAAGEKLEAPRLYQWYDDDGEMHITDEKDVPPAKRSAAKVLEF